MNPNTNNTEFESKINNNNNNLLDMSKSLEEIKKDLKEFFENSKRHNIKKIDKDDEVIFFNAHLFELEIYLFQLKKGFNINMNLNSSISSTSISESFNRVFPDQFHRPVDYQYYFVLWLFDNFKSKNCLHQHIDLFIDSISKYLIYPDIQISDTGATRCKTNVRMTIVHLRNYGILLSKDDEGKRSHFFTTFGFLLAAFLELDRKKSSEGIYSDEFEVLKRPGYLTSNNIEPRIYSCINRMKEHDGFTWLWNQLSIEALTSTELKIMKGYFDQYIFLLLEGLDITDKGVKENQKRKNIVADFIKSIEDKEDFKIIKTKIMVHFRTLK